MGSKLLACAMESRGLKLLLLVSALCALFALPIPAHSQSGTPPAFPSATAVRLLAENSTPFHPIGAPIAATDQDSSEVLTYSLSGRDSELFDIEGTSGQLQAVRPMDYESGAGYSVAVRATDPAGLYDTVAVNIRVTNVDETGEIVLSHEVVKAGPLLHATLTDPDGRVSGVSWQWAVSTDKTNWKDIAGAEAPSYSPSAEDLRQYLKVEARYADGHGPGKVATALFNTDLWSPAMNHPPEFPFSESGVRSVSADAPAGQDVGHPVLAGDLDRDLLTYWLAGDAAQLFVIGHYTGQLKTRAPLDQRLEGRYFGVVHVLDGRGGSANLAVRVDVGDVSVPAALPPASAALPVEAKEPAPTPAAASDGDLSPGSAAVKTALEPDAPQASATGSLGKPGPLGGQASREEPASTPAPLSRGATGPAAGTEPATAADDDVAVAAAALNPPAPPLGMEGGLVNAADPTGGTGAAAIGGGDGFGSLLGWLVSLFVGLVLLAVVLVWLMRRKGARESEVSLPPPTVGPERRLGPLPVLAREREGG